MIITFVTSKCMRRAARQFRWTKILSASCVNDYYFCYIELYEACRPPAQMDQNIKCKQCSLPFFQGNCLLYDVIIMYIMYVFVCIFLSSVERMKCN